MQEDFLEVSKASEVNINSDFDADLSDASDLCFSQSIEKSDLSSLSLSSSDGGYEEDISDMDDPDTVLSSIHSEDTDSDDLMADLNYSAVGSCNICCKAMVYHFHCDTCNNGSFDICRGCWEMGAWCKDQEHQLRECKQWKYPGQRQISFHELRPEQELMVFETGSNRKKPDFHFTSKSRTVMPNSPPIVHPSMPLVAWYLSRNRVLLGNYADGSSFTYRTYSLDARGKCF
jgi:hypothetical protein